MNDNNLQQILLQTEVAPPQQAWEKIVVVLDELEEDKHLQQKVLSAEAEVPFINWESIEQTLNDRYYSEKLELAEAEVPLNAWEQIYTILNDGAVADKLNNVTENPPANVWPAIEKKLSDEGTGKVIPFEKKYTPVFRLAAAALITGILAWGAYRLLHKEEEAGTTVAFNQPVQTEERKAAPIAEVKTDGSKEETTVNVISSRSSIKKRIKQEITTENTIAFQEPVNHDSQAALSLKNAHHKNQKPLTEASSFSESQYLVVLNDAGDLIRVSKKLSNMQCAKGAAELPVDAAAALQSKNCDEQIKRWQQKIAASTAISPSAGYIDLSEILLATEK